MRTSMFARGDGAWRSTSRACHTVAAIAALAAGLLVSGCSGGSGGGVATNPAVSGGGTAKASASASPTGGVTPAGGVRTILAPLGLNLRGSPSSSAPVLGSLAQGTIVTVMAHTTQGGGWYQVKGASQTGWMTDNSAFSSPRHFSLYQSDQRGFSALYLDTWTFAEEASDVAFRPQTGPQRITVTTGPNLTALGQPGRAGYTAVSLDSVEVYGFTGVLRLYDMTGTVPSPTTGAVQLAHLAEIRVTIDASHAMRIDFDYVGEPDLQTFRDFYNSIILPTPGQPGSGPPTPTL